MLYELAILAAGFAGGVASYGVIQKVVARWKRVDFDTADSE